MVFIQKTIRRAVNIHLNAVDCSSGLCSNGSLFKFSRFSLVDFREMFFPTVKGIKASRFNAKQTYLIDHDLLKLSGTLYNFFGKPRGEPGEVPYHQHDITEDVLASHFHKIRQTYSASMAKHHSGTQNNSWCARVADDPETYAGRGVSLEVVHYLAVLQDGRGA